MTPDTTTPQSAVPSRAGSRHSLNLGLLLAVLALLAATAGPANAAEREPVAPPASSDPSPDPAGPRQSDVDPDAAATLAGQKRIPIAEARARLGREKTLGALGEKIEKSVAGRSGGTYLDSAGSLVVTTLDAEADAAVKRSGARPQRVDDSAAKLDAIMAQLDRQAAKGGAGAVQGWYVDVPTNTVVVTVTEGATDATTVAVTKLATSFGSSVRIERKPADLAPRPAEWLAGGFQIVIPSGNLCSVGFNTLDASNRHVVLTAGHCVTQSGTVSRNGYWIGATRTANYPTDDFGTFWNSYPTYWQPSPSVYKWNNTYVRLAGQWNTPTVGSTVCKSGRTTGYTCGTIRAVNQTVTYTGGKVIGGLVRHDACVEGGDSGGANISAGAYALGVTSGASTPISGVYKGKCLSKTGSANISWYQPVGEALSRNGLRLLL